tara:strand:- start:1069 stop:1773 length:705 start_codon:yes stop_codon:yes gene_type:complete
MVSIDTIYQRVLALANKEQRGYITPQEFNLFANQAQMDIFEQYFYDIKQFNRVPGDSGEYSDIVHNLNEKIATFEREDGVWTNGIISSLSGDNIYRLGTVIYNGNEVEEVQQNEILYINQSPLTKPNLTRPVYVRTRENRVAIFPDNANNTSLYNNGVSFTFLTTPAVVRWGYVVVSEKAMYDPSTTTDFQLHSSEQGELTNRILALAGITLKQQTLTQIAAQAEQARVQQEKQ